MRVLVVGDGPVSDALDPLVRAIGWSPTTVNDLAGVEAGLDGADAVVVLSHHDGLDAPAIGAALAAGTSYVGAMGSRSTQARRRAWLQEQGVPDEALGRLRAPIGLDIGADEPGEIAVAIVAEIVAQRRGAAGSVGSISARDGAIHPDLDPGTAYCPGG